MGKCAGVGGGLLRGRPHKNGQGPQGAQHWLFHLQVTRACPWYMSVSGWSLQQYPYGILVFFSNRGL